MIIRSFKHILILTLCLQTTLVCAKKYIGGDEWNRPRVSKKLFLKQDEKVRDLILRTVKVVNTKQRKIGTAFLIKEDADHYIFLTNFHVVAGKRECKNSKILLINEDFRKRQANCDSVIQEGSIASGSDYTYFKVKKSQSISHLSRLSDIDMNFPSPIPGDKLVSVGFGGGRADLRRYDARISMDNDCVYLNGNLDITFNKDNVLNVFFTACDAQSGDSGSAVMNRETGEIIGLFFAVADQKKRTPLSSKEIADHLGSDYMGFYTNASMSIDLRKIKLK